MPVAELSVVLRFEHRIATSPLAGQAGMLRGLLGRLRAVLYPELGLLHQKGRLTDACVRKPIYPDWNCLDVGSHLGSVSYTLSRLDEFRVYALHRLYFLRHAHDGRDPKVTP